MIYLQPAVMFPTKDHNLSMRTPYVTHGLILTLPISFYHDRANSDLEIKADPSFREAV